MPVICEYVKSIVDVTSAVKNFSKVTMNESTNAPY